MELTPNDIRNFEFQTQMRGYDKEEVDALIKQVAELLDELKQQNLKLSMENDSTNSQLSSIKELEETIKNAAIDARKNADILVSSAKEEAEKILSHAKETAGNYLDAKKEELRVLQANIKHLEETKQSFVGNLQSLISSHMTQLDSKSDTGAPAGHIEESPFENQASQVLESLTDQVDHETIPEEVKEEFVVVEEADEVCYPEEAASEKKVVEDNQTPEAPTEDKVAEDCQAKETHTDEEVVETYQAPEATTTDEVEENADEVATTYEEIGQSTSQPSTEHVEENNLPAEEAQPKGIDSELAAALDNYQHTKVDEEQPAEEAPPVQSAYFSNSQPEEEYPEGFVAGNEHPATQTTENKPPVENVVDSNHNEAAPTDTAAESTPEKVLTSAVNDDDDDDDPMSPKNLAATLDSVVAKFEEEMDKAETN